MDAEIANDAVRTRGILGLEPGLDLAYTPPARPWPAKKRVWLGRIKFFLLPLCAPLALLGLWQASATWWTPSSLLPPPSEVFGTLSDMAKDGSLFVNLGVSFRRVALGYGLGSGLGLVLGLALGFWESLEELLGPTLDALNQVPIYAYLPLVILFLGLGEAGKVAFIAVGSFYPMLVNAREGARSVDPRHLEVASVYGYSRAQSLWKVILPEAAPFLLSGARLSLGLAWMLVVGAELFGASSGVGYLITWSRQLFQTDGVIVGILAVSAIGWTLDQGLRILERRALAWKRGHGNAWA